MGFARSWREAFGGPVPRWRLLFLLPALCATLLLFCKDHHATAPNLLDSARAARNDARYDVALTYLDRARRQAAAAGDKAQICKVQVEEAWVRHILGEFNLALRLLYSTERMRKVLNDRVGLAEVYNHIGAIQQVQKNYTKALEQYELSLSIYQDLKMEHEVGRSYNNIGSLYEDMGDPAAAIRYHRKSEEIWRGLDANEWLGVTFMQLGTCMDLLGRYDSAQVYYTRSLEVIQGLERDYMMGVISIHMGKSALKAGKAAEAIRRCKNGLDMAERLDLVPVQQKACDCLYMAYEAVGDPAHALAYHKRFVLLRDSVFGQDNVKELTRIEMSHAFAQQQLADSLVRAQEQLEAEMRHQEDVAREREGRNIALFSVILFLGLSGGLWSRLRYMRRSRAVIQRERERSDELLLNILPEEVAQELKDKGSAEARDIAEVSILFTDFKGFTALSEELSAQDLVAEIDTCFKAFDAILSRYDIEKIKTIGDAYMAAGGLPNARPGAVADTIRAALDMQAYMIERATERRGKGLTAFDMRAGIHTGPVVAGIVGVKKFAYDIWGDTVNTASRMESSGAIGRVNISGSTFALVKDEPEFVFEERGKVEAKGKGEMVMYFVERTDAAVASPTE
ncbi:MAG: adenylate/guanylate cyclase domain-containing protein [Flavobacteriales bacterium]